MAEKKAPEKTEQNPWKIKKPITLPRVPGARTQPDVTASVNGRMFRIKRGVEVEVPLPIFDVLQGMIQSEIAADDYYYGKAAT